MDLSIILPVYNVKAYLEKCLDSLVPLLQNPAIELIAIDDGSSDGSSTILNEYNSKYNFKLITQTNKGLSRARNVGLNLASGEYIAFVDSDDFIDYDNLLKILKTAKNNDVDIIVGDFWVFDDNTILKKTYLKSLHIQYNQISIGSEFLLKNYKLLTSVVWRNLYKRDLLIKNSIIFKEGIYYEDVEFTPRIFERAKKVIYSAIPFYYYRKRSNSITSSNISQKKIDDSIIVWQSLDEASFKVENEKLARLFRENGFHCFLFQYAASTNDDVYMYEELIEMSKHRFLTKKYSLIALIFNIVPIKLFHLILKCIK